jgi:hypothetical protein
MITPPPSTYFIHGLPYWSKDFFVDLMYSEVSVSIQKDGFTVPLRPLGFILEIQKGGIISAFDKDVASKLVDGKKVLSIFSRISKTYSETELDALVFNTPRGKHNELWVDSSKAEIVGGYTLGNTNSFEKAMKRADLDVHHITNIEYD